MAYIHYGRSCTLSLFLFYTDLWFYKVNIDKHMIRTIWIAILNAIITQSGETTERNIEEQQILRHNERR